MPMMNYNKNITMSETQELNASNYRIQVGYCEK